jgi:hypothetical protein
LAVISALQANRLRQVDKCGNLKCVLALSEDEFAVWNSDFPMQTDDQWNPDRCCAGVEEYVNAEGLQRRH